MSAITSAKSNLGFVGIGYMGRPIAQRLLESGFRLTTYDRHRTKAEKLIQYGGTVAENVSTARRYSPENRTVRVAADTRVSSLR
jgi:2-hydroxy-3-oxopropionate reductase